MTFPRLAHAFVLLSGFVACAGSAEPSANELSRVVSIRVTGFVEAAGIT
jgi:hypothetical protein